MAKTNPVGMKKQDLTDAMYQLLGESFPEFEYQVAFAREFGIALKPREDGVAYDYPSMVKLVSAIQEDGSADQADGADDEEESSAGAGAAAAAAVTKREEKVVYYRGPVRRYGVRPTITGPVRQPDGSISREALCGPIHLVFGTSPQGVCKVDEAFARQHRDVSGQHLTFERMIEIIESSPAYGVEFHRIAKEDVFRLGSAGDKKVELVRGAVSQSRKA